MAVSRWSERILSTFLLTVLLAGCATPGPSTTAVGSVSTTTAPQGSNPSAASDTATAVATTLSMPSVAAATVQAAAAKATPSALVPGDAASMTPSSSPQDGDAKAAILAARKAQAAITSFHAITTIISPGKPDTRYTTDYVAPDRFRIVLGEGQEIVAIGTTSYIKLHGQWQAAPGTLAPLLRQYRPDPQVSAAASANLITDAYVVGHDSLDGKPMTVYQYTETINGQLATTAVYHSTTRLWVGTSDGLLYKEDDQLATIVANTTDAARHVTDYSGYNGPITIEVPVR